MPETTAHELTPADLTPEERADFYKKAFLQCRDTLIAYWDMSLLIRLTEDPPTQRALLEELLTWMGDVGLALSGISDAE